MSIFIVREVVGRGRSEPARVRRCVDCNHANGSISKCHICVDVILKFCAGVLYFLKFLDSLYIFYSHPNEE